MQKLKAVWNGENAKDIFKREKTHHKEHEEGHEELKEEWEIVNALEIKYKIVLDCAFNVHKALGPGLLEQAYQRCLAHELRKHGFKVETEKVIDFLYDDILIENGYRVDIMVDDEIIIELKSVDNLKKIHLAQILTYMKLTDINYGLLVNYNVGYLKDGIKRVVR